MSICPICEMPRMHTRLYGAICRTPGHDQIVSDIMVRWVSKRWESAETFSQGFPEYDREMVLRVIEYEKWPF